MISSIPTDGVRGAASAVARTPPADAVRAYNRAYYHRRKARGYVRPSNKYPRKIPQWAHRIIA